MALPTQSALKGRSPGHRHGWYLAGKRRSIRCHLHPLPTLAKVRKDAVLGPFFEAHVADWDQHLEKMVEFWSSTLRGTGRYRGTPMPKHAAQPGINVRMFERWLWLFRETTLSLGNPALRARADDLAARIAQSLLYGYQMSDTPDRISKEHSFA